MRDPTSICEVRLDRPLERRGISWSFLHPFCWIVRDCAKTYRFGVCCIVFVLSAVHLRIAFPLSMILILGLFFFLYFHVG